VDILDAVKRRVILTVLLFILLVGCGNAATPTITPAMDEYVSQLVATLVPSATPSVTASVDAIRLSAPPSVTSSATPSVSISESVTESVSRFDPTDWKNWPVLPDVDPTLQAIYEYGQALGNDPHAFSIFGDCQSRPDEFLGVYETNPATLMSLSPELNETVENFRGSFNRESPTSQDGTTPGALLWSQWHQGNFTCSFNETPVECELRIHNPSFVIIQIGTHFESRNAEYLRKIITQLMDAGVVPILATKADNREKDERINRDMAMLADEYDLPLWNFWAAVSDLPNRGLYTRDDRPLQGDIYLTDEAARIHRNTGLEALDAVWRVATGK